MTQSSAGGGPRRLAAVVLDWAGTTVDYGCRAPAGVFVEVFRRRGIEVSDAEARGPMGMAKREHIRQLTLLPSVAKQWRARFGGAPTDGDVDDLYRDFIPLQLARLAEYSDVIPGVPGFVAAVRARGLKVGATTGYSQAMAEICARVAAPQGYQPDVSVTADDVPAGRPAPWMALVAAMRLGVYPPWTIVKIGDTYADVEEGLNAGMWTIGVTKTGNELGLSEAEANALPGGELRRRLREVEERMLRTGAHYVAECLSDCLPHLDAVDARLARGEKP